MKNLLKSCFLNIRIFIDNLMHGLRNAEIETLTQAGASSGDDASTNENIRAHSLAMNLLKGEVTQEVEELVYRTYLVDREAQGYAVMSPTLAVKKDKLTELEESAKDNMSKEELSDIMSTLRNEGGIKKDNKFLTFENEEGWEVITIQNNHAEGRSVLEELEHIDKYGPSDEYLIKIETNFFPRFRLEAYTTKLAVRKIDDRWVMLDFYVSSYANPYDIKSRPFVREIQRIKDEGFKSTILSIEKVYFVTQKAYKVDDMLEYEFDNLIFKNVSEFDGSYVLHFKARMTRDGYDLTKKFYSESMAKKYEEKAPKERTLNLSDYLDVKTYVCEMCGKEVTWDTEEIDELPIATPRDIDEEREELSNVTEYMDIQMAEMTFGKRLCKDCLKKYLEEREKKQKIISNTNRENG